VALPIWRCSLKRCSASLLMLYADPPALRNPARPEETLMIVAVDSLGSSCELMKWCVML